MRILVSGSTGLIGSALMPALRADNHHVLKLVRSKTSGDADSIFWNPATGEVDPAQLDGFDAVVHLAAENIAARRWTASEKKRIMESRALGTRLLCEHLSAVPNPPRVLLAASAVGFYGERGDQWLTEQDPPGTGFLCEVVRAWEQATEPASRAGVRVVNLRFGIVLSPQGGTLAKLLPLYRFGLGGPLGGGRPFMSWLAMPDLIGVVRHALQNEALQGPLNVTAPNPVRQSDFARILGRVIGRPAWFSVPRFALRLRLGKELADSIVWSQRVRPDKLITAGYQFRFPDLEAGLRNLLKR